MKRYDLREQGDIALTEDKDGEYYLASDVDALLKKDSLLTREHNLLVQENRQQATRISELEKALRTAENALARCYDVTEWPAERGSTQLAALGDVRKALGL